ncbi:hypothetical protein RND71_014494 [Anisodus tanguticus]|uniref:Uncharacterized protein n=1 Tax=Anisodus tanguticus TaxID=243964 RepID=A0AAE1S979_9SOLA|nr:hypothetical protein RND71_014494 [Anisodus tanguticus]
MTVIKLKSGELWVHAPISPTKECIQLVKELGYPVKYIVLPTFAYEHKIFVGPFSRKFPKAQVWVAPRQWSWPLNLPLEFLGIFRAKKLEDKDMSTPWADDIKQKEVMGSSRENSLWQKRKLRLCTTDPCEDTGGDRCCDICPKDTTECSSKESLLASANNGLAVRLLSKGKEVPEGPVVDNKINRQKGPSSLLEPNSSFAQMSQKLIVSPIVKTLVFSDLFPFM